MLILVVVALRLVRRRDQIVVDNVCTCPASTFESPNGCTKSGVYKTLFTGNCDDGNDGWRRAVNEYECGDGVDRLHAAGDTDWDDRPVRTEDWPPGVTGCYLNNVNTPWFNTNISVPIQKSCDHTDRFPESWQPDKWRCICVQDCRSDQIVVDNVCTDTTCSSTSHSCISGSLKSSPDSITCSSSTCTDSECCNAPASQTPSPSPPASACAFDNGMYVNSGNCACGTSVCTSSTGLVCTAATNTCAINPETSVGDIRKNTALDKKQKMMQFKAVAIARKTKPSTITEIEDAYPDKLMRQKRERVKASKMELIKDDLPEVYATIKKRMKSKIEYVVAEYYPSETMDCDGLEDGIPNCCSYDFSQDMDTTVMVGLEETVGAWSVLCNGITIVSKQTRKSLTNETLGSANYDMQCWNGEQFGNNVAISTGGEHACGSYRVLVGSQFIDGITWTCIAEYQKMQTSEGHLRVDQLKTGDRIKMANGKYTTVQKIKKKAAPRHALHEVECNGATAHLTDNHVYRCNNRWHHPKNRGRRLSESDETIDVYSIQTENHCKDRLLTSSGLEIEPWDGREAGADRPYFYDETGYRRNCMTV